MSPPHFLDDFRSAAAAAEQAEMAFRREASKRISAFEQERIFAYRRVALLKAVAAAVETAEDAEIAKAAGVVVLRARLGWSDDSEPRAAATSRFAPVAAAIHACQCEHAPAQDVGTALQAFEAWYLTQYGIAFWSLFEQEYPETPVVDFERATDFERWLVEEFASTGPFTALVVLVEIGERSVTTLSSTFFNVVGDEIGWGEIVVMFEGSRTRWDGAAFFPLLARTGGPLDNATARVELRLLEARLDDDRLVLNEGRFFDKWGRKLKIEEVAM